LIAYPPSLLAVGGAHSGIAPVNLLDVEDTNGNFYYWSDRPGNFAVANTGGAGPYLPWLIQVPSFTFYRSLQSDVGSFVLQNLSGDSLSRDFEKIARRSALEGAFYIYRCWQADAEAAWLEVHGTLTVPEGGIGVDTVKPKAGPLFNPAQLDTPLEIYCETCQLQWGGRRCGSTEESECNYNLQTCQSVARFMGEVNSLEKNFGEAIANTAGNVINRRRLI
jgi:hypothetical protein